MSFLFVREDREYLLAPGDTLETDLGVLEVPGDVEAGETVETHLGEAFTARALRGPDLFNHFERTGAPMMPRDVGLVIGHTGVGRGDRVLDAGTGTGVLSAYLGRCGADVTTYERDSEFAEVARENMRLAAVTDRVEVRTGDLTEELDGLVDGGDGVRDDENGEGAQFDVLTLDTRDADAVVARAPELLADGGYVAVYSPFVEQTRGVVSAARDAGLGHVESLETIQREMDFDDRGSRPSTAGVGHTGYLTVARNV